MIHPAEISGCIIKHYRILPSQENEIFFFARVRPDEQRCKLAGHVRWQRQSDRYSTQPRVSNIVRHVRVFSSS